MNYRYWMVHVQLYRGVTLKYQHAVGQMIQQEISLGLEDKNQHFQMVLDHRQVSLTFFFRKKNINSLMFSDHTTGTDHGYYLFIETSFPQAAGDKARIISPLYNPAMVCVRFFYHMYGASIGTMNILIAGHSQILWSKR